MALNIRTTKKRVVDSPVVLFLCLLVSMVAISGSISQFPKERNFGERVAEKQKKLDALREERDEVARNVVYLESERGREEYIRRLYGAAMAGEIVVVVSGSGPGENNASTTIIEINQKSSWLSRWFFREQ